MVRNNLICIILCLISVGLFAQQPYSIIINDANGLPSNSVYSIKQDSKGFIWLATQEGLCRYDGFSFKSYKNSTQTSSSGSNIKEDITGRIWYQNFDGYCYYNNEDSLKTLNQNKPLGYFEMGVTSKNIFLIQGKGVDVYDINTLKIVKTIPFSFIKTEISYTISVGELFYMIADTTLYSIDKDFSVKKYSLSTLKGIIPLLLSEHNGVLLLASRDNSKHKLYALINDIVTPIAPIENINLIHRISEVDSNYWVLSPKGVSIVSTNQPTVNIFNHYSVSDVIKDNSGNYWLATLNSGILLIPSLKTIFNPIETFEPSLLTKHHNGYFLFTLQNEIIDLNNQFKVVQKRYSSPTKSAIYYANANPETNTMLVSSIGTSVFNLSPFKLQFSLSASVKEVVTIDKKYMAMAASGNAFLFLIPNQPKTLTSAWDNLYKKLLAPSLIKIAPFLNGVRAKTIAYDSTSKTIYCGANIGLYKQSISQLTEITQNGKSLFVSKVIAIPQSIYALSTRGELLLIKDDSIFTLLNQFDNIQIADIKRIKQFGNNLCVLGNNKLLIINLLKPHQTIYTFKVPIKTAEINDVLLDENTLHVLTQNGIISEEINTKNQRQPSIPFIVTQTLVNGQTASLKNQTFPYLQNNISIQYSILNYTLSSNQILEYNLNNEGWTIVPSNIRNLQFASLSPGKYLIQFRLNNRIVESQTCSFVIEKPFWLRWWFIILIIFISLSIGYSYYKWQIQLLIKKNRLTTEKIELENELNKSKLTSIKSQMNPHFFYNALNTIQSYIFINDKKAASNYLAKFSKLTRLILEMSEKEWVRLNEEIEALTLYLELEKMRFEEQLHYTFTMDDNIDIEMVKIPPMLIQPYIENAIKHGLLHKTGDKNLHIIFTKKELGYIEVTIDDNGIGRKKSVELNSFKKATHTSFSTGANEKRLSILNKGKSHKVGVVIEDKFSTSGMPEGTKVILHIPIN